MKSNYKLTYSINYAYDIVLNDFREIMCKEFGISTEEFSTGITRFKTSKEVNFLIKKVDEERVTKILHFIESKPQNKIESTKI